MLRPNWRLCDEDLTRRVQTGELDMTFAILPPIDGPQASMDLLADPYALLVRTASPLGANGARPDQAALSEIRIIGCRWERRDVEDLLRERSVGPPSRTAATTTAPCWRSWRRAPGRRCYRARRWTIVTVRK